MKASIPILLLALCALAEEPKVGQTYVFNGNTNKFSLCADPSVARQGVVEKVRGEHVRFVGTNQVTYLWMTTEFNKDFTNIVLESTPPK